MQKTTSSDARSSGPAGPHRQSNQPSRLNANANTNSSSNPVLKLASHLIAYRLPILSGFLIGTSYIPFPPWALFFCLVPLFLFWKNAQSAREAFIGGWITQFILTLIGFHWIAYTATEFGHFPLWGGLLTLLGFASLAHLHYAIAGGISVALIQRLKLSERVALPLFATVFALCDHRFPMIFPWHLGYPWLWAKLPGAQFADVIGFEGLNLVTIGINALLAAALLAALSNWHRMHPAKPTDASSAPHVGARSAFISLATAIGLFAAVNFAGLGRAEPWKETDAELPILAVQGNIGNFDKLMVEKGTAHFREPIVERYVGLSRKGLEESPDAKILIWPETAFPDLLDVPYQNDANVSKVRDFIRVKQVSLLTGAYSYEESVKDTYNGFFFMNSTGQTPLTPYRKSLLLVFGETFPFSEYLPYMDKLFPDLGSFGRGAGPQIMSADIAGHGTVRFGPQICYEGLYPWFTAELAKSGAQILTNVTNDSWFGKSFEPHQHLIMTLARAIEFRRPLMRSTNTGITTAILASGETLQRSPQDQEWAGLFRIRYKTNPPHTVYEKIAGQWGWVLAFLLVVLLISGRTRKNDLLERNGAE